MTTHAEEEDDDDDGGGGGQKSIQEGAENTIYSTHGVSAPKPRGDGEDAAKEEHNTTPSKGLMRGPHVPEPTPGSPYLMIPKSSNSSEARPRQIIAAKNKKNMSTKTRETSTSKNTARRAVDDDAEVHLRVVVGCCNSDSPSPPIDRNDEGSSNDGDSEDDKARGKCAEHGQEKQYQEFVRGSTAASDFVATFDSGTETTTKDESTSTPAALDMPLSREAVRLMFIDARSIPFLQRIEENVSRLTWWIENCFTLMRLEEGEPPVLKRLVDVSVKCRRREIFTWSNLEFSVYAKGQILRLPGSMLEPRTTHTCTLELTDAMIDTAIQEEVERGPSRWQTQSHFCMRYKVLSRIDALVRAMKEERSKVKSKGGRSRARKATKSADNVKTKRSRVVESASDLNHMSVKAKLTRADITQEKQHNDTMVRPTNARTTNTDTTADVDAITAEETPRQAPRTLINATPAHAQSDLSVETKPDVNDAVHLPFACQTGEVEGIRASDVRPRYQTLPSRAGGLHYRSLIPGLLPLPARAPTRNLPHRSNTMPVRTTRDHFLAGTLPFNTLMAASMRGAMPHMAHVTSPTPARNHNELNSVWLRAVDNDMMYWHLQWRMIQMAMPPQHFVPTTNGHRMSYNALCLMQQQQRQRQQQQHTAHETQSVAADASQAQDRTDGLTVASEARNAAEEHKLAHLQGNEHR